MFHNDYDFVMTSKFAIPFSILLRLWQETALASGDLFHWLVVRDLKEGCSLAWDYCADPLVLVDCKRQQWRPRHPPGPTLRVENFSTKATKDNHDYPL